MMNSCTDLISTYICMLGSTQFVICWLWHIHETLTGVQFLSVLISTMTDYHWNRNITILTKFLSVAEVVILTTHFDNSFSQLPMWSMMKNIIKITLFPLLWFIPKRLANKCIWNKYWAIFNSSSLDKMTAISPTTRKISQFCITNTVWGESIVDFLHKGPVMRKASPWHDIIMVMIVDFADSIMLLSPCLSWCQELYNTSWTQVYLPEYREHTMIIYMSLPVAPFTNMG